MLPRTRKKLHEKCTRHESTRVQLPFALQKQKREFQTRGDERAQKAPRESLFRRRSSSYLGQRPTAITGYLNIFQGCWNQCFQVWHCMSIAKSGKLRISQDFANSCRMPCFARLHVEPQSRNREAESLLRECRLCNYVRQGKSESAFLRRLRHKVKEAKPDWNYIHMRV